MLDGSEDVFDQVLQRRSFGIRNARIGHGGTEVAHHYVDQVTDAVGIEVDFRVADECSEFIDPPTPKFGQGVC